LLFSCFLVLVLVVVIVYSPLFLDSSKITGWIDVAPNKKNERDLDISVHIDFDGHKGESLHQTFDYILR
jgi:hypothetical protein